MIRLNSGGVNPGATPACRAMIMFLLGCILAAVAACDRSPVVDAEPAPSPALAAAESPAPAEVPAVFASLRKGHPRILLVPGEVERIKKQAETDPLMAKAIAELKRDAEEMLSQPPAPERRDGTQGHKFLEFTSRGVLRNVSTLALVYLLDPDPKYLKRVWAELEKAAAYPDWNPQHFLSTAEMTLAFSIGYDWLYAVWTPEQREVLRKAIVEKGLVPGNADLRFGVFWVGSHSNWNAVCSGGLMAGALAVADTDPELAGRIVQRARESLPKALGAYGPNGGYDEGVMYWNYGTSYVAIASAVQQSALGSDAGFSDSGTVSQTGLFPFLLTGPSGKVFNYGDSDERVEVDAQVQWLARRYENPGLAALARNAVAERQAKIERERAGSEPTPWFRGTAHERMRTFEVLWLADGETKPDTLPLDFHFLPVARGAGDIKGATETAVLRGSWSDPDTFWIAIKAGGNTGGRAHLDAGTFVLDALGERWAVQLGGDNYSLPDYFVDMSKPENRPKPYKYFRKNTQSKNTLTINGANQIIDATAPITGFGLGPHGPSLIIDLTPVYAGQAASVHRGIALPSRDDPKSLCAAVRDEWSGVPERESVRWAMMTDADVQVDGRKAVLSKNGKSLLATIVDGPSSAVFRVQDATPPTLAEDQNKGKRILAVDIKSDGSPQMLEISFTRPESPLPEALPLSQWLTP